jgi:hypothetical protein
MKTTVPPTPKVVLRAPHTALGWLLLAKAVYDGLSNNKGLFVTPNPPLPQLSTDIDAFDAAQTATQTRAKGAAAARDAKLVIVRADLVKVCAYVQGLADATPADAATIAQNAGLALRKTAVHSKAELSAKPDTTTSGSVDLAAKLGDVTASHEWQYSTDGGKTWTSAQTTLQAKTTITGLVPATTVSFRHRAITKTGPDAWSQPVSMIVV